MYKEKPWTLNQEKEKKKSSYIKNRETDLAISISRVQKLFEKDKTKTYSNNEISNVLGISLGTVSDITNRLEAVGDIKIVRVRQLRSALSQVFQHKEGPQNAVTKERGRTDVIVNVMNVFKAYPEQVFTRNDLIQKLDNTESKIRRALQILLLDGKIKLVGDLKGSAQYQYYKGSLKGTKIYQEKDERYISLSNYIKKVGNSGIDSKQLDTSKSRLFYSSQGLVREYLISYLDKELNKNRNILENIFKNS